MRSFPLATLQSSFRTARIAARILLIGTSVFLFIAALTISANSLARGKSKPPTPASAGSRLSLELAGTVATHDGERLHLISDLGNIVIHTVDSGKVDYRVHLEADASEKNASQLLKNFMLSARRTSDGVRMRGQTGHESSGRLWITIEVNIPKNYSVYASTGGGNIEVDDVSGRVTLSTAGGNVTAGNIGGSAHLETNGGHITVKNVSGDLAANTGGGHITTGAIAGNASLRTSGGHIHVFSIDGSAHLVTGGGNVTLEHSGGELVAETSGGQIEVGEAAGLVRAKTSGGGIRVVRVSGPSDLQTGGGSIYLTQVNSAVKASTGAGGITAWFVMAPRQPGNCDLQSSDGDIVVYLPRRLPVTIDAEVQMGDDHRVIVDPAFPLRVTYDDSQNGPRLIRAEGSLNGGGEILRLRAVEGNIRVVLSDANRQVQLYNQQMEQLQEQLRQLRLQLRNLISSQEGYDAAAR